MTEKILRTATHVGQEGVVRRKYTLANLQEIVNYFFSASLTFQEGINYEKYMHNIIKVSYWYLL